MGALRLLLAISVFTAHLGPLLGVRLVDGPVAVQAFFIISGFYVSLVLHEKYGKSWSETRLFYSNRLLRLYPSYWVMLGISIGAAALAAIGFPPLQWLGSQISFQRFTDVLQGAVGFYVVVSNLLLFGIDWAFFLTPDNGALVFTEDFRSVKLSLNYLNPVPQAWSLGIEIAIYLVAPFLFRLRLRYLFAIFMTTMAARWIASSNGLDHDPWTYRFMPFEAGLFVVGAIAYRVFARLRKKNLGMIPMSLLAVVLLLLLGFEALPKGYHLFPFFYDGQAIFLFMLSISLPFIFMATKNNKIDRFVGDLSYPFYLAHIFVMWAIPPAYAKWNALPFLVTLGMSFALLLLVDRPVDRYRQYRASRAPRQANLLEAT